MGMTPAERQRARRERLSKEEAAQETRVADAIEIARLRTENASLRERLLATETRLDRLLESVTNRDGPIRHKVTDRDVTGAESPASPRLARGSTDLSSVASSLPVSADPGEERESETSLSRDKAIRHKVTDRDVTGSALDVALSAGADLFGDLPLGDLADRIANAVQREPTAARDGVTAEIAATEAVVHVRSFAARYPDTTAEQLVAEAERHVVKHILGDCRRGVRKVVRDAPRATNGPRKPWRDLSQQERDDAIADENASRPKKAIEY